MQRRLHNLPITHDGYLKLWQLSQPNLVREFTGKRAINYCSEQLNPVVAIKNAKVIDVKDELEDRNLQSGETHDCAWKFYYLTGFHR